MIPTVCPEAMCKLIGIEYGAAGLGGLVRLHEENDDQRDGQDRQQQRKYFLGIDFHIRLNKDPFDSSSGKHP